MNTEITVLEALYEKIDELPYQAESDDARARGYRAAVARARLFVLDERAGVFAKPA